MFIENNGVNVTKMAEVKHTRRTTSNIFENTIIDISPESITEAELCLDRLQ